MPLRAELLPVRHPVIRVIRVALLAGAGVVLAASLPRRTTDVTIVTEPASVAPVVVAAPMPGVVTSEAPSTRARELLFVFDIAGSSYVKLADVGDGDAADAMPRHAAPKLVHDKAQEVEAAIAVVREHDVPLLYRTWHSRTVKVDGTCTAKVTGFAVVARLTGDPSYAGIERETWDVANVMTKGNVVLAAKLDGCKGTYARDAALSDVIVPVEVHDEALAARARAALLASQPARDAQHDWLDGQQAGHWYDDHAPTVQVLRHPRTGVTWVSVLGHRDHGCGDPEINVWGLFRVGSDGALAPVQLRKVHELDAIDRLVDVDGDGELEVLGKPWLGLDEVLEQPDGHELARLTLPYYGCPC